ncbi:MAG TPA: ATP-grasp domain-containing protein [Actinomycetota bacterium]|nr:ATP-grasp domain-containing protein [Actinomycetota bacterium]
MDATSHGTIAIVDPFSMAAGFGPEVSRMGHRALAVLTLDTTDPYLLQSLRPQDFAAVHRHRTLEETLKFLRESNVAAIVPGHQTSLDFTDLWADRLGLIGSPVETLQARANKRVMKEHWTRHGVPCAAFYESGDVRAILAWAESRGYPVVLKPPASAGSCHVYVCPNEGEVTRAFAVITTAGDVFGRRFDTVLAEEYLDGDESMLILLHSGDSHGALISAVKYEKVQREGHASIYRNVLSQDLDDPTILEALPVVRRANAAIGVRYGINDNEFKVTSRGLRVIEVNNRLPGANLPAMVEKSTGLNCYRANVRIFLGEYSPPPDGYRVSRHFCVCCLINDRAGEVVGYEGMKEVERLPSFHAARLVARMGEPFPATEDLTTTWALVFLVNEDRAQLIRDAEVVHGVTRLRVAP